MKLLLALAMMVCILGQTPYLKDVPITFALEGDITYTPSTGGAPIPGYSIRIGYDRFSWLGIQFMTLTSFSNYDTLILQRSKNPSNGVYTCSIGDYYISSGRPNTLMKDRITSLDQILTSSSSGSYFQLLFPRTLGNTSGQDWEGGQIVDICFFTSSSSFSESTWSKQYSICLGYQIKDRMSTHRGAYLGSMDYEGVNSRLYGAIYGPYLQLRLYWHRPSLPISNSTAMYIRIGERINDFTGYDFYHCGVGDKFGQTASTAEKDLQFSGYDNGECILTQGTSSRGLEFIRDGLTYDGFDYQLRNSFSVCLIGTSQSCKTVAPPILYPIMSVASALQIYGHFIKCIPLVILFLLLQL